MPLQFRTLDTCPSPLAIRTQARSGTFLRDLMRKRCRVCAQVEEEPSQEKEDAHAAKRPQLGDLTFFNGIEYTPSYQVRALLTPAAPQHPRTVSSSFPCISTAK
jgi:hypothetical protein